MGFIRLNIEKNDLESSIKAKEDELPDKAADTVLTISNIHASAEEVLSPVRTGQNRDETLVEASGLTGCAWPDSDHARFIIEGTEPHIIQPVNAKALYWPGADHPVMLVHHPGTAPNDYVQEAMDESDPGVDDAVSELGDWVVDL